MADQAQMRVMVVDEDDVFSTCSGMAFRDRSLDVCAFCNETLAGEALRNERPLFHRAVAIAQASYSF
jgi:hypothetical protein